MVSFRPKTGNRFSAKLKLVERREEPGEERPSYDFGNKVDLGTLEPFWTDPKTRRRVCEAPTSYVLREREGDGWKQIFSIGRLMCQKAIPREHAIQIARGGKNRSDQRLHLEERPPVRRVS